MTRNAKRKMSVSSAILLDIERSWYRELCQEMVFCTCVCPYAYVAGVFTCLWLCPSENQVLVNTLLKSTMQDAPIWLPNMDGFFMSLGRLLESTEGQRNTVSYDSAEFFSRRLRENERTLVTLTLRI